MSFATMIAELRGSLPKIPISYAPTLINRAWGELRQSGLWSFNLFESSWITPPIINSGTATFTQGSPSIQFDSDAITAINTAAAAQPYSLITQRQIRSGVGGIYNIIQYDPVAGGATLDRMWADPGGTGMSYTIYQVYYTPPYKDHLTWLSVRNPQMFLDLSLLMTRKELDKIDPQRLWYAWPTDVVGWGVDQRGAGTDYQSGTYGYQMYELWGQPVNPFTYQCYGLRRGQDLVDDSDELPVAVGEDTILAKARYFAYEWAEANKDVEPRSQGPDWRFLMGKAESDYIKYRNRDRRNDREFVDNWFSIRGVQSPIFALGHYNTIAGVAGPA